MNLCVVNALHIILYEAPQIYFFIVGTYLGYSKSIAEASFTYHAVTFALHDAGG